MDAITPQLAAQPLNSSSHSGPTTPSPKSSQTHSYPATSNPGPQITTPSAVTPSAVPATITGEPLPYVQPLYITFTNGKMAGSTRAASLHAPEGASQKSSSFLVLSPSNQGWLFLGVAWYWWVVGMIAVALLIHFRSWFVLPKFTTSTKPRVIQIEVE